MKLKYVLVPLVVLALMSVASAQIFVGVKYETAQGLRGELISGCIGHTMKIHVYLNGYGTHEVKIEIVKNVPYWFDEVVSTQSKIVTLNGLTDVVFEYTPKEMAKYFVRVYVDGKRVDPWQLFATEDRPEFIVTGYYWVGLRMKVNGEEYLPDDYAPVPSGASVEVYGYLYRSDGTPASGVLIEGVMVNSQKYTTYTNSEGYFVIKTVAPKWEEYRMCGEKGRYILVRAIVNDVPYYPWEEFKCRYVCPTEPTPTPTPTPKVTIGVENVIGYTALAVLVITVLYMFRGKLFG